MKKLTSFILGILITASVTFAVNAEDEKSTFSIDTKASKVYWKGKKVTGEHTGYLSVEDGTVFLENNAVVGAQINMDLNSIVCTDLTDEQWNQKLVGHLKSEDFFSVEKFPNANFKVSSVKSDGKGGYLVTGDLTIKGTTHEINFPSKINVENGVLSALGTATIDRTKWNIQYGSGKFFEGLGDKMIYDDFEITFEIQAKSTEAKLTLN